jgi:flagellar protein FlaF
MKDDMLSAYDEVQSSSLEGRALEAQVLQRAARKLAWCAKHWSEAASPQFRERLAEALDFNQRLWTLFQVELLSPDNPLEADLRGSLVRLSQEVDKRSFALHAGGELSDLKILTRLNESVASGLQETGSQSEIDNVTAGSNNLDLTA